MIAVKASVKQIEQVLLVWAIGAFVIIVVYVSLPKFMQVVVAVLVPTITLAFLTKLYRTRVKPDVPGGKVKDQPINWQIAIPAAILNIASLGMLAYFINGERQRHPVGSGIFAVIITVVAVVYVVRRLDLVSSVSIRNPFRHREDSHIWGGTANHGESFFQRPVGSTIDELTRKHMESLGPNRDTSDPGEDKKD